MRTESTVLSNITNMETCAVSLRQLSFLTC